MLEMPPPASFIPYNSKIGIVQQANPPIFQPMVEGNLQQAIARQQAIRPQPALARMTQFGYSNDPNWDRNSNQLKIGMRDNPLTSHVAALSPDLEQRYHANPGDVLDIIDNQGHHNYRYFGDRTSPKLSNRVDLYQPTGFDKSIPENQKVINLGGGNPSLKGRGLAQAGEQNVQKYIGQNNSMVMQPQDMGISRMQDYISSFPPALGIAQPQSIIQNAQQVNAPSNQSNSNSQAQGLINALYSRFNNRHPLFARMTSLSNDDPTIP